MRRLLNERELGELLDQAQIDLFRLGDARQLRRRIRWRRLRPLRGGRAGTDPARKEPWLARLRADAERGLRNRRVHVLRSPVGDYLRYESEWGYLPNSGPARTSGSSTWPRLRAPRGLVAEDFWLMDNGTAVRMHYDDAGRFLGASVAPKWRLLRYRRAAAAAWHASVPFGDWWAAHPQYHRERVS